jgi:hypothetical protein
MARSQRIHDALRQVGAVQWRNLKISKNTMYWTAAGVILALLIAVVGFFLDGSSTVTVTGTGNNCNGVSRSVRCQIVLQKLDDIKAGAKDDEALFKSSKSCTSSTQLGLARGSMLS